MKTQLLSLSISILGGLLLSACSGSSTRGPASVGGEPLLLTAKLHWQLTQGIDTPEGVYYNEAKRTLYVSNVAGQPDKKDRKGWITKVSVTGKVLDPKWIKGLHAPKGMRVYNEELWVSDIDRLIGIDTDSGKIKHRIRIKGAKFLNDVAVGPDGSVFVSDTLNSRIYRVRANRPKIFVQGKKWESPNGLLIQGNQLWVAAWGLTSDWSTKTPGNIYSIDLITKEKSKHTYKPLGNLDGLELDENGNFLVSDWKAGKVYWVSPSGEANLLLSGFKGPADIAYIPDQQLLIVPRMGENRIDAYRIEVKVGV